MVRHIFLQNEGAYVDSSTNILDLWSSRFVKYWSKFIVNVKFHFFEELINN